MAAENKRSVTLKDVANAADVHVSTASRALDPTKSWRISRETIERVQSAADELGYMPDMIAKGLKRGTTLMVGVIVADLENPFMGPLIRGVAQQVEQRELVTVVTETFESRDRFERALNYLLSRRVDAVISTAARTTDEHLLARFAERIPAFVLAVRNVKGSGLPFINQDDVHGAELAAGHLLELGHHALAQLRGPIDVDLIENRTLGFRRTVSASSALDLTVSDVARELTVAEGRRLMALTLDQNRSHLPTAVFAHNDLMAIGAIEEIAARGLRCPQDISIVGYNDAPLVEHLEPPLSTIRIPGEEIGRRAGQMVLELIDDPSRKPESVSIPATLIPRGSTGPPGPEQG